MAEEAYKQNVSGFASYATPSDFVEFRDWRLIGDLIRDDDRRAANVAEVLASTKVQLSLNVATGMIESEMFRGGRYSRADMKRLLAQIGDPDDGDAAKYTMARDFLRQLTCDLAFWILNKRRKPDTEADKIAGVKEALETLESLRHGEAIFPFLESVGAGVGEYAMLDPYTSQGIHKSRKPFKTSVGSNRMFGHRANGQ